MDDLIETGAAALVDRLARREIAPEALLDALEARIAAVDPPGGRGERPTVNALPTLCFERARARAAEAVGRGPLHGLPVAIKDLSAVAGVRTTWGSTLHADDMPEASAHVVERIEAAGGLVYAKSNTPEFGAGANTINEVFGATRNPYDLTRSAAGSSGGSAAALRIGTAWLAHGSDLGGSLRNPASFCGVVGLRPSPGRVPGGPALAPWDPLSVEGPMARTVEDVALFLDAMAGPDLREPMSLAAPERPFLEAARAARRPLRVAFSPDLGITPVEPEVAELCEAAARRFEAMGAKVERAEPDLREAHSCFQTLRALKFIVAHEARYDAHAGALSPEIRWNFEAGLKLTPRRIAEARRAHGRIVAEARAFFDHFDLLLCPATVVTPYPVETRWPQSCAGRSFETYIDWLAIAYAITLTGCPALSLPCGFTAEGLPVGLQMVGAPRGEAALLGHAAALEAALALDPRPIAPRAA